MKKIYLGSVSMESNRWAPGRVPTFNVSDFIDTAISDGFDGIELWQYHYTSASEEEKAKLAASGIPFVFNSYISFVERDDALYKEIGDAIKAINAKMVKFNLGSSHAEYINVDEQIDNLKRFAEFVPADVKLLSECHANSVMEVPEEAAEIFAKLDKDRFGAIIHLDSPDELIDKCYAAYGDRILHMHCAYTGGQGGGNFTAMNDGTNHIQDKLNYHISKGFNGSLNVEFVKFEDTPAAHYAHAVEDLKYLRKIYK